MATVLSRQTGNFLDASTWGQVETATGALQPTLNTTTNSTTSYVYSPAFTVTNSDVIEGVMLVLVKLGNTGTISVALSDDNGTTATREVTVNMSDLPSWGCYMFFKFGSTLTGDGGTDYKVGVKTSTNAQVQIYRSSTTADWCRWLRKSTTAAPAAGDDIYIVSDWTAAATNSVHTVTMNETATTQYGRVRICWNGTLTFNSASAGNPLLRVNGNFETDGTLNIGTSGTPIPGDSTAILEMVCSSDGQFGFYFYGVTNIYGSPRTAGKNVVMTKLTADAAAAATSLTVADDTGWLNGDEIALSSTTRTASQYESRTLNANAGASSLSVSSGLTNAHGGSASSKVQAEVVLLTRNVKIRSTSSSNMTFVYVSPTATFNMQWCEVRYSGTNASTTANSAVRIDASTAFTMRYCVTRDGEACGPTVVNAAHTGWTIRDTVVYNAGCNTNLFNFYVGASTGSGWTVQDVAIIGGGTLGSPLGVRFDDLDGTITNLSVASVTGFQNTFNDAAKRGWVVDGLNWHSNTNVSYLPDGGGEGTIKNSTIWRNNGSPSAFAIGQTGGCHGMRWENCRFFGNNGRHIDIASAYTSAANWSFYNCQFSGDSTFSTTTGINFASGGGSQQCNIINWRFDSCTFGDATGIYTAHTNDFLLNYLSPGLASYISMTLVNCKLASGTEFSQFTSGMSRESYIASHDHDQTANNHKIITSQGTIIYETTTVDSSPGMKLTPTSATIKLRSNGNIRGKEFRVHINSGQTRNPSIKVRKDSSYNGNAPRLIALANPSIGINTDTVIDTLSVGADTWETLTGAIGPASAKGVVRCIVDGDGTAGNFFVDTFGVT